MTSRLLMGVAVKIILLISTLSFCAEAQVTVLVVDVDAKQDVQVFWFIFSNEVFTDVTYTVYYAINTDDPINFNSSSSDAIMVDAADFTSITVTTIPPSSNITVVVVASNSTGVILESSPPVTRQTFGTFEDGKIPAPEVLVPLKRFDDNTTIQVTWLPIDSPQIVSYDIEYGIYTRIFPEPPTTTIISSPGPNNLAIDIIGVDGDTNYQVRVRGVAEVDDDDKNELISTDEGLWSPWVVSQVKIPMEPITGGSTSIYTACNGIIFATGLIAIIVFF